MNAKTNKHSKSSQKGRTGVVSSENIGLDTNISLWEAIFSSIHLNLLNGPWFFGYCFHLGFSILQSSYVLALSLLCYLLSPVIAIFADLVQSKKTFSLVSRLIAVLSITCLPIVKHFQVDMPILPIFAVIFLIHTIATVANSTVWCDLINSLPSDKERSRFLTNRHTTYNFFGICALFFGCMYLDYDPSFLGFNNSLVGATIFGLVGAVILGLQPANKYRSVSIYNPFAGFKLLLSDRFKKNTLFISIFSCGYYAKMNLNAAYFLQYLSLNFTNTAVFAVCNLLGALVFMNGWKKLTAGFGSKNVILFSVLFSSVTVTVLVLLAGSGYFFCMYIASFIEGACAGAVNSSMIDLPLKTASSKERAILLPSFRSTIGLFGAIGTIIGGLILTQPIHLNINPQWGPFELLTIISSSLMLLSTIFLNRQFEPPKGTFKQMLPHIIPTLFFFWRKPNFAEETEKFDK